MQFAGVECRPRSASKVPQKVVVVTGGTDVAEQRLGPRFDALMMASGTQNDKVSCASMKQHVHYSALANQSSSYLP